MLIHAHQIQNYIQTAYNSLQYSPGKCSTIPQRKIKQKQFPRSTRESTSSGVTLDIPFNRKKSFANRSFSYAAAKYWNDLPHHIRNAKDIKIFKSLFKTHFFKLAFPSK